MFRYGKHEIHVVTTRFSRQTWIQNQDWREKKGKRGCLYGQPRVTTSDIPVGATMIVIEMNNDSCKVEGLGLCLNKPLDVSLCIYGQRQYDRVAYAGRYRVGREFLDSALCEKLERLCFSGQCHLKRGIGFTSLPKQWLSKGLARSLREAFRGCGKRFAAAKERTIQVEPPGRA